MKSFIEVKDRKEAEIIRRALNDPVTRATVLVIGALLPLQSGERRRVMNFCEDKLKEQDEEKRTAALAEPVT